LQLRLLLFSPFPLDELAYLAADVCHHSNHVIIGCSDAAAEQLNHTEGQLAGRNRESKTRIQPAVDRNGKPV
jgi:hypothetical protein